MAVKKFVQPDYVNQADATVYKGAIDSSIAVLANVAGHYAPRAADTPNMTVLIEAGRMMYSGALVSNAQQTVTINAADATNPRIDRITIAESTGVYTYTAGTAAASPTAPAIPAGQLPVCQVSVPALSASITNSQITDERTFVSVADAKHEALVSASSGQSIPNATETFVLFNTEHYDTDSIHNNSSNTDRLTIPPGFTRAKFIAKIPFSTNATGKRTLTLCKNGIATDAPVILDIKFGSSAGETVLSFETPKLIVNNGDYFNLSVYQNSGAALSTSSFASCFFAVELYR